MANEEIPLGPKGKEEEEDSSLDLPAESSEAEFALSRLTQNGLVDYLSFHDALNLRRTSKALKRKINEFAFFQQHVFGQYLRKGIASGFPTEDTIEQLSTFYKAVIQKDKSLLKDYHKEFFTLMLDNLAKQPKIVCALVQISSEMGLVAEDFKELGEGVVTLFRFLTQPIEDTPEDNQAVILSRISGLKEQGYSESHCRDLERSINATFAFLRRREGILAEVIYKNLSGANLEGAELCDAYFVGANLAGTDLHEAILDNAYFEGAYLVGAYLVGANLVRAELEGANLEGANLSGANLRYADLEGANFTQVNFSDTVFFDKRSVDNFIDIIEASVRLNSAGILPLLLAINTKQLEIASSEEIIQLNNLSKRCLLNMLTQTNSVEALSKLLDKVCAADIFRYSPDMSPDVLCLIANTYMANKLECHDEKVERKFKEMLIQEIKKQKSFLGFHNEGWNELLERISNVEPKFNNSSNRQQMQQT